MVSMIIYPSDFFNVKKVDDDFKKEYDAALLTGTFTAALFNYDQWLSGEKLKVYGAPDETVMVLYRGWMFKPEQYRIFYNELQQKNIHLITTPEEYEKMHLFPNVYEDLQEDTAQMIIFPEGTDVDVEVVKSRMKRFMVKDYVKSVKGTEFPRFFDENVTQEAFDQWMKIFYQYRGELYTGGICIKEFLDLKYYGNYTNEFRVFYMNHEVGTVCRNSHQGDDTEEPPGELIEKYKRLGSPFYTIDLAELSDGTWRIVEAGDGGVSGLSDGQSAETFYRRLHQAFKNS